MHLGPALLRRPLALLSEQELTAWRNGLVRDKTKHCRKLTPSSINRTMRAVQAALILKCPERAHVWRAGLKRLPNAEQSRNKLFVLPDATICAIVADAYTLDAKFGLLCEGLSETGTRPVQAARMKVGYLIEHASASRLLIPKSAKGGGRNRAEKKRETYPLPISVALAMKLKQAAAGRADDDRLLLRADGMPWNERDVHADYSRGVRRDCEGARAEQQDHRLLLPSQQHCASASARRADARRRGEPSTRASARSSAPIRSTSSTIPIS